MIPFKTKAAGSLTDHSNLLFGVLVLATICMAMFLTSLKIDNSLEGWFLKNDPALSDYDAFKALYGNDEVISVLVEADGSPFDKAFAARIYRASETLEKSPLIRRILSISHAPYMDGANGELRVEEMLTGPPASDFDADAFKQRAFSDPLWKKTLFGKNRKAVLFLIEPAPVQSEEMDTKRPEILAFVNDTFEGFTFITAGMGVMYEELNRISMTDSALFPAMAYLLLLGVLFLFIRKGSVLAAASLTIALSALFFMGFYALCGQSLNMLSAVLPTLIIIICLADVVHIFLHYQEAAPGPGRLKRALSEVLVPCLFTSVTTAIGFSALASSPMAILKSFGTFASMGVLFAFVISVIVCAWVLGRVEKKETAKASQPNPSDHGNGPSRTDRLIERIITINVNHHTTIVLIGLLLIGTGMMGALRLTVDTYSINFLLDSNKVKQESRQMESAYGNYLPLEIRLRTGEPDGIKDPAFLTKLATLQETLDATPGFENATSLADVLKQLNRVLTENDEASYTIPATRNAVAQELLLYELDEDNDLTYLTDDAFSELRLTVKIPMVSGKAMAALLTKAEKAIYSTYGDSITVTFGGYVPLYVKLLEYITTSQIKSFLLAFVCIFAVMAILFKTPAVVAIGIIPNMVPILLTLGFMGCAGIYLDIATVTISVIVIGIAVDDTIHFIFCYNTKRKAGASARDAVAYTLRISGKAIIITSVMLIVGYSVLLFASIKSVIFFGLLISVSMLTALLCDLFLLPSILLMAAGEKAGTAQGPEANRTQRAGNG